MSKQPRAREVTPSQASPSQKPRKPKQAFGIPEKLASGNWRARYTYDLVLHKAPHTFSTKEAADLWIAKERKLIDSGDWTPPAERLEKQRRDREEAKRNTFGVYAAEYLVTRNLRPSTLTNYRRLLDSRLLPTFEARPLRQITLTDVRAWRSSQPKSTPSQNAAAYRLLRSILAAAEADEMIERSPARIRGAATAKAKNVARPASLAELKVIIDAMPEPLRLLVVLAAFCGLRQGELLELRRSDVDGLAGRIAIARQVAKDAQPGMPGACASCGRVIGPPKTDAGRRVVYLPARFLPMLRQHLLQHTGPGDAGLLFPGIRTDHMSARFLLDRYRSARAKAGRDDLTIHHLRHTALTIAGQEGATAAELKHRAGHSSLAAMAIYQHSDLDRDKLLADRISESVEAAWDRDTQ